MIKQIINNIAKQLHHHWKQLAIYLNFKRNVIKKIDCKYMRNFDKMKQILALFTIPNTGKKRAIKHLYYILTKWENDINDKKTFIYFISV